MKRLMRWLFPAMSSPYARCHRCEKVGLKAEMFPTRFGLVYFCDADEAHEDWARNW